MHFFPIDHEKPAYLTEEPSTSAIIKDFGTAIASFQADPIEIVADKLFHKIPTSDLIRHDAVMFGIPASRA